MVVTSPARPRLLRRQDWLDAQPLGLGQRPRDWQYKHHRRGGRDTAAQTRMAGGVTTGRHRLMCATPVRPVEAEGAPLQRFAHRQHHPTRLRHAQRHQRTRRIPSFASPAGITACARRTMSSACATMQSVTKRSAVAPDTAPRSSSAPSARRDGDAPPASGAGRASGPRRSRPLPRARAPPRRRPV